MRLIVRCQQDHCVEIGENTSVIDVKALVGRTENLPVHDLVAYSCGKPLNDADILMWHVSELSTLNIDLRLRGGKVHGSLARAGKVKGQTPKVEKQETSKKKTGRAKRRVQYNRRFVNAVVTLGKRKGPNSNSE